MGGKYSNESPCGINAKSNDSMESRVRKAFQGDLRVYKLGQRMNVLVTLCDGRIVGTHY